MPPVSAIATSDWSADDGGGDSCRPRRLTSRLLCLLLEAEVTSGSGATPVLNNNKKLLANTHFYIYNVDAKGQPVKTNCGELF